MRDFRDLMPQRIQRILLVSSLYESFILSEEGQLQETLLSQFAELNLSHVPDLVRVSSAAEALERIRAPGDFDLVISSIRTEGIDAVELTRRLRDDGKFVPVLVLAYSNRELTDFMASRDTSLLDGLFLWQGDARILLAMVKQVEDRRNVAHDTGKFGVPAILVVEDNVRFYSSFLPVIYAEIYRHTQRLLSEDLNLSQRMLRLRARPKALLCRSYEEAWYHFTAYEEHVLGVISDIEFPRRGALDRQAGLELCARVHEARPDIRLVLQSSLPENRALAESVGASFLLKGSPVLLQDLRKILVERFGFGDFVFRLPDHTEVDRAPDLRTLADKLATVPAESLAYHAARNHFSNWLKARTEFALAEKLRPRKVEEFESVDHLRAHVLLAIGNYRRERNLAIVADFRPEPFDAPTAMSRIGEGSLGGKARGIAFANRILQRARVHERFPDLDVFVPTSVVLGTQVFDEFLERRGLANFAIACDADDEVVRRFLAEPFPKKALADLRAFLARVDAPLAVRSSSLLEDSPAQPFAGVYHTYMLTNDHTDLEVRLVQLVAAVKRVYASTFSAQAKAYVSLTAYRLEEEKMAVLIQRVVGLPHDGRFYPDFAGVARSYNFYPQPPNTREDGVVAVALGLGRTVVDGAPCLRFCPKYPQHLFGYATVEEALANAQREFYALDLGAQPRGVEAGDLRRFGLDVAEQDGVLTWLGSTYLPDDDRVVEGISRPGVRLVSFAPVLRGGTPPVAEVLAFLLEECSRGTAGPVEIEFAGNLGRGDARRPELAFLQLRPLALTMESEEVAIGEVSDRELVCRSDRVLGNGRIDDIVDLVVVDAQRFERSRSVEVAQTVGAFNAQLQKHGRPYILIGAGRWGSADPFLGIPVGWHQVAGARVIVETGLRDLRVTPSQGTHFFQNLTSCHVGYFTVNAEAGEGWVDWEWLRQQPAVGERDGVRHVRLAAPVVVVMSGKKGKGVVLKHGPP